MKMPPLADTLKSQRKGSFALPEKNHGYAPGPHPLLAWISASLPILQLRNPCLLRLSVPDQLRRLSIRCHSRYGPHAWFAP